MPTYVYECQACKATYEAVQRITDQPHEKCSLCQAESPERLITATSFVLKGGGWYADGYSSTKGEGK